MAQYKFNNACHRVTLRGVSTSMAEGGRKTTTYPLIATIWASIVPSHQAPQYQANKTSFPISHEITTRYAQAYESARRIEFGMRVFEVRSKINVDEKKQLLVFRCEEINNA